MKAIEFLSLNIEAGDKVSLTYRKYTSRKPDTVVCFFDGYEIVLGHTVNNPEWIIPVFRECSKNGKMLSKRLSPNPYFSDIVSVERVTVPGSPIREVIDPAGSESLFNAVCNITRRAEAQARELLREMDLLFPGKKVYLASGFRPAVTGGWILAVRYDKGGIVADIYNDIETNKDVNEQQAEITDWPTLLHCIHHSIENAPDVFETEDAEDIPDFFLCDGKGSVLGHADIPDTQRGDFPLLDAGYVTDMLKARLWLDSLNDDRLPELFPSQYESWKKTCGMVPFPVWLRAGWRTLPRNTRYRHYTENQKP